MKRRLSHIGKQLRRTKRATWNKQPSIHSSPMIIRLKRAKRHLMRTRRPRDRGSSSGERRRWDNPQRLVPVMYGIRSTGLYFLLASESESRERFLRLRFLASAAFTLIFCPGFK